MTQMDKTQSVEVEPARGGQQQPEQDSFSPVVDIYEDADGTAILDVELPGVAEDDVDIRVDKGVLTISASARSREPGEKYNPTYVGFASGASYYRAFTLSDEFDRDKIDGQMDHGVLRIRLPRAAAAQTRKIPIRTGK